MKRLVILGIFLVGMLLGGCSSSGAMKPQSYPIPAYPNSGLGTLVISANEALRKEKITRFEVSDSPEIILAWYEKTLIENGWELDRIDTPPTANQVSFNDPEGCSFYEVTITTIPHGSITQVEIKTFAAGCI